MPLIGILLREDEKKLYVKKEIFTAISRSGGIPIGIYIDDYEKYLNLCDGFIFPGGDDFTSQELECIKIIYESDKPLLGICLGMQEIGVLNGGTIIDIPNHLSKDKYVHNVYIIRNSLLYKILNKEKIMVNSRHKSTIINTKLKVCAKSIDGISEEIEDSNKKFFMGLQWHPESIMDNIDSQKIFASFIEATRRGNY